MGREIKVMIVDDSAVVRKVMSAILDRDPGIRVIGTAHDPIFAIEKMRREWPDVLTLDIEMPRMDGITFLGQLMQERPTPVVICSSLTTAGAETTLQALAAGAVSIITKPGLGVGNFLQDSSDNLVAAVKAAARANMGAVQRGARARRGRCAAGATSGDGADHRAPGGDRHFDRRHGGPRSLADRIAAGLAGNRHRPAHAGDVYRRLCRASRWSLRDLGAGSEARATRAARSGADCPGGKHMQLARSGAQYVVEVREGPPVNRHRPSVDVLFRSVAKFAGKNAMGVIMTGMGDDGARGLKEMHDAGAYTLAQDEATCVVYGMPKEAVKLGAVDRSLPLQALAAAILNGAGNSRPRQE
jgi:two-component system chemotaxis response regulator CheB